MKFLTSVDLNKNELQNAVLQPLAADPANPREGQIYYNSTEKVLKQYNGTEWKDVGSVPVEESETNGSIKIDGQEVQVYELPVAGEDTVGGIKIGTGFTQGEDGKLNVVQNEHFTTDKTSSSETDEAAITRAVGTATPIDGDTCVIRTLIAGGKYSYTAFVYESGNWQAMDGNYDANNVIFGEDIAITTAVGNIGLTNGQGKIPATGKNLKQVFEALWTKEDTTLTISQPAATLAAAGGVTKEVGSSYDLPSASVTLSTGSYEYGSKDANGTVYTKNQGTGITFGTVTIKYGDNVVATQTDSNSKLSGTLSESVLPAANRIVTDADITHTFSATAAYPASTRYPVTNLGNFLKDISTGNGTITGTATDDISAAKGNIAKKDSYSLGTKSITIKGYRPFFYGKLKDNEALTSAKIRGLTNGGNYNEGKSITIKADGDAAIKKFIVAIPSSSTRDGITHVDSTAGMTVDVTDSYILTEKAVKVADARELADAEGAPVNAVDYDVYVFSPASIDAATVHVITLG